MKLFFKKCERKSFLFQVYDEKLGFYPTWPELVQQATTFTFGWSYVLAWTGLALTLMASVLFSGSAICMKQKFREIEEKQMMVKMHMAYPSMSVMRQPNGTVN